MLNANNIYVPLTIAPLETRTIVLEDIAAVVPLFNPTVRLRSLEPSLILPVTFSTALIVTDAPLAFTGTWSNTVLSSTLGPEAMLLLTVPATIDGLYTQNTITITNPDTVSNALVHLLLNGSYEAMSLQHIPTSVVIP